MEHVWRIATYVLTFPEGLIWPGLRTSWYPVVCALWLPFGLFSMIRAAFED